MTETQNPLPKETSNESPRGWLATGKGKVLALATVAAIVTAGAFGVQAVAQSKAYQHFRTEVGHPGGGWGGPPQGGWHGRDHGPFAEMSDEEAADRIQRMVRHVGIEIDATPEQEQKLVALAQAVVADLRPLRERMQATKAELHGLLTATTIDRDALERLRAARLAEADQISKTLVDAIADAAEVLTPEQRVLLEERIREFRGMRHHRRG